ncbi:FAD/NAD(P)-binding oxidoreductase [Martelella sp. AD-3]|uniref:NAD(P)/FAD-dependent oxidoreductase n=1 Tax=Martelella sp. AD-3 TaxID=686597 RepID=UPI000464FE27|nr:FAD/NAD(P)-binding oxidoreductase [Martelella sp. AD-3]AMM86173.1 pyridine nucleotide-disulfide oxidoreductase [Martelella sp. AD-3]
MTNVTIIGTGFAALTTARELRRRDSAVTIRMISPRDALHYLPSTIWLPAHLRQGEKLKVPLAGFFDRYRIDYVPASVTGLGEDGRTVLTDNGTYRADHVVIASGARFIRRLPGIEHALVPCEGIAVGEEIARRLEALEGGTIAVGFASNPKEQGAVRGGPMFEFLFIIDTLLRKQKRRDRFHLVFFNPSDRPGQRLGDKAVDGLLKEMKRRDIETRLGHKMVRFEEDQVVTEGGAFAADLILFMPGLTGPAWLENTDLPLSPGGMIAADEMCRVKGREGLWVVGDSGSFPGPEWMPKQAHQADLQGVAAAENIACALKGEAPRRAFKPELICIVDTLDAGILVFRNARRSILLPKSRIFHWLKRYFERHYLKAFRDASPQR